MHAPKYSEGYLRNCEEGATTPAAPGRMQREFRKLVASYDVERYIQSYGWSPNRLLCISSISTVFSLLSIGLAWTPGKFGPWEINSEFAGPCVTKGRNLKLELTNTSSVRLWVCLSALCPRPRSSTHPRGALVVALDHLYLWPSSQSTLLPTPRSHTSNGRPRWPLE